VSSSKHDHNIKSHYVSNSALPSGAPTHTRRSGAVKTHRIHDITAQVLIRNRTVTKVKSAVDDGDVGTRRNSTALETGELCRLAGTGQAVDFHIFYLEFGVRAVAFTWCTREPCALGDRERCSAETCCL
jgi:hypothetical protein